MTFEEILDQAIAMLQRRGRLTYRTLKRQFQLDDETLEDLTFELIEGQRIATDEKGTVLVWVGSSESGQAPAPAPSTQEPPTHPTTEPECEPLSYTPPHLTKKILTTRSALEGERKQVTVLFCDLQNSTPLAEKIGPENQYLRHLYDFSPMVDPPQLSDFLNHLFNKNRLWHFRK